VCGADMTDLARLMLHPRQCVQGLAHACKQGEKNREWDEQTRPHEDLVSTTCVLRDLYLLETNKSELSRQALKISG